jgi:tRNA A37 methylthiotransferase MiaB
MMKVMYVADAGGDVQSQLLQSVIGERSRREQERKLRLSEERNKEKEGKEHNLLLWEQERLFTGSNHKNMESMWEVNDIFL